jgi:hypothetical protein
MARLESDQAEKEALQKEAAAVEPSAPAALSDSSAGGGNSQSDIVSTDSVDELTAAYGEETAEAGEAAPLKQVPES